MNKENKKGFLASTKAKICSLAVLGLVGATNAMANITFEKGTGFSGEFNLTYFYSAISIVVTAIAIVAAIGVGIRQFRKI